MTDTKPWHGIPREDIPWYPKVDDDACIGCQLCYITCGRSVYEMGDGVAVAVDPMSCAVGCSTCGNICPTGAITFPPMDAVWKLERERQIFRTVKKEAARKHEREDVLKARAEAQRAVEQVTTRARVEIAGEFGDKQFLVRLEELIEDKPYDIVNLRLEVPTVKGARQKAPSYMSFEVTSEATTRRHGLSRRGQSPRPRHRPRPRRRHQALTRATSSRPRRFPARTARPVVAETGWNSTTRAQRCGKPPAASCSRPCTRPRTIGTPRTGECRSLSRRGTAGSHSTQPAGATHRGGQRTRAGLHQMVQELAAAHRNPRPTWPM